MLYSLKGNSCDCGFKSTSFADRVNTYDFIAHVRIVSIPEYISGLPNTKHTDFAKLELIELFKGEKLDSILVLGIGTSCDMGMRSGQEWIMYGQKSNNQYQTGYCSNSTQVNNGFTEYESDAPFFLSNIYTLRKYFQHSLKLPPDGIHESHFKDGRLKSRFRILKNQIDSEFFYVANSGKIFSYNFVDGHLEGKAFIVYGKSVQLLKYDKEVLYESSQYVVADNTPLRDSELYKKLPDSFHTISKTIYHRESYLPDGSRHVTVWNMSRNIRSIAHYDKNGNDNFSIRYFDSGLIEGFEIYNDNTGIRTRKDYYPNGILQTEWITCKDGSRSIRQFKPNGTIKE